MKYDDALVIESSGGEVLVFPPPQSETSGEVLERFVLGDEFHMWEQASDEDLANFERQMKRD